MSDLVSKRSTKKSTPAVIGISSSMWGITLMSDLMCMIRGDEKVEELTKKTSANKKKIIYNRTTETDKSTIGSFTIPGTAIMGYFIEPAGPSTTEANLDRRIPGGVYNLIHHKGTRFTDAIRLYNADVPKSRAILIHSGNFPDDTEGCLMPGTTVKKDYVGPSKNLFEKIRDHFKDVGLANATMVINEPPKK